MKNIWNHFWTDLLKLEQDKSATTTLWLPQMNQYTASNDGGGGATNIENQREHHIILTKYEAVPTTNVSENNAWSEMLIILTKTEQFVFQ